MKYLIYGAVGYFLISRYLANKTNGTGCTCSRQGIAIGEPPSGGVPVKVAPPSFIKLIADPKM